MVPIDYACDAAASVTRNGYESRGGTGLTWSKTGNLIEARRVGTAHFDITVCVQRAGNVSFAAGVASD